LRFTLAMQRNNAMDGDAVHRRSALRIVRVIANVRRIAMLYKYLAPDRIDVFQKRRIRFAPPGAFNDPFESVRC
jgi:hypothetical protein